MAVEARHLSLFSSQFLGNTKMMNAVIDGNTNAYGNNTMSYHRLLAPLSGTTTMETLLPMYGGSGITDSVAGAKTAIKADSGLTYTLPVSRKRPRDAINPLVSFPDDQNQSHNHRCGSFSFLGEDISLQIQQQQFEIDRFVTQHMEKVKLEMEEKRKWFSSWILAAVDERIVKKLRAKEDEIEKIGKLNLALEERVKSLCIENQIWRDLAQTNEATANVLRSNLEQVLNQVNAEPRHGNVLVEEAAALMDDAESCCGSNYGDGGCGGEEWRTIAESGGEKDQSVNRNNDDGTRTSNANGNGNNNSNRRSNRCCRNCGISESCVLLLPCRHLCLCTVCGSSVNICPVCKSTKNASVHVNLSS